MLTAACSGSGSSTLTKTQLIGQADAICAKANRTIAGMYRPDPLDAAATAAALEKVLVRQRTELRALRAMVPPTANGADYGRWLTQIGLALDQDEASRGAIAKGDVQAAAAANHRGDDIRSDADRFAKGYGMRTCAQP
jgi:hypothetical protein